MQFHRVHCLLCHNDNASFPGGFSLYYIIQESLHCYLALIFTGMSSDDVRSCIIVLCCFAYHDKEIISAGQRQHWQVLALTCNWHTWLRKTVPLFSSGEKQTDIAMHTICLLYFLDWSHKTDFCFRLALTFHSLLVSRSILVQTMHRQNNEFTVKLTKHFPTAEVITQSQNFVAANVIR